MDRATVCDVSKPAQEVESSPIATDPSANAPSELVMLLKCIELVRVLAAFLPGRTLEYFFELQRSEVVSSVATPGALAYLDPSCNTIGAVGEGFEAMPLVFVFLGSP